MRDGRGVGVRDGRGEWCLEGKRQEMSAHKRTGTGTQDAGSALRARPVATNKLYGGVIYIRHNVIVARSTVALRDTIELFRLCEKFLLVPLQASLTCLGSP